MLLHDVALNRDEKDQLLVAAIAVDITYITLNAINQIESIQERIPSMGCAKPEEALLCH